MKDLWRAINLIHPLITKARLDHVAVVVAEYEESEEGGGDSIPVYEVRVKESMFSRKQLERLNRLFKNHPKFRGLSYQLFLSDKALIIFEVEDEPEEGSE